MIPRAVKDRMTDSARTIAEINDVLALLLKSLACIAAPIIN
ncbi:hypothetical protein [Serratia symbiotica]|nr:hypothetical protein [Serratia symbiotica]